MQRNLLIADDDDTFCYVLKEQLVEQGFEITTANDGHEVLDRLKRFTYDLLLLDLHMPGLNGYALLLQISQMYPQMPIIILTGQNDAKSAVDCMKAGAFDYIVKPYIVDELIVILRRALDYSELQLKNTVLEKKVSKSEGKKIVANSAEMKSLLQLAERAAGADSNILIQGETGTGKELLAEFIHQNSGRANKPFVVINCASMPDQLIESELFGYEKGAFTDAKTAKQGLVEIANGGTLFLDEIGEMSLAVQPKLLRFLENGEFRRIGGLNNIHASVRVISATNRDLVRETENKSFRKDLLFRLNVITLTVPPLRKRREDILFLAQYFLERKSPIRSPKQLSEDAKLALSAYEFPGNIRELEHIIERSFVFAEDAIISKENLFLQSAEHAPESESSLSIVGSTAPLETIEREHIKVVLHQNNWEQAKSASQLGISVKTLYNKIKKYGLVEEK